MTETHAEWKARRNECEDCGKPTASSGIDHTRPGWVCKRCVRRNIAHAKKAQGEWALHQERVARLREAQIAFLAKPEWERILLAEAALFARAD